jgi:hypothetical protein
MQIRVELGLNQMGEAADPLVSRGPSRNPEAPPLRSSHQTISQISPSEFHQFRHSQNRHLKSSLYQNPEAEENGDDEDDDDNYSQLDSELEWN